VNSVVVYFDDIFVYYQNEEDYTSSISSTPHSVPRKVVCEPWEVSLFHPSSQVP